MNCSMAQGTELRFLSSGIRILPNQVEYESDKVNYDYARVDITRQAGDHIKEYAETPEPVEIRTGDRKLADVYFGTDSLTLDNETAQLELLDGRKVLERGVIDKRFHTVTLGNIFEFFKNKVEDADIGEVITDVQLVNADRSKVTESYQGTTYADSMSENEIDPDDASGFTKAYLQVDAWTQRSLNGLGPIPDREEGGFDFNQASLAQVLQLIEKEFELQSYIDGDRVLKVGNPEVDPEMYFAGYGSDMFKVSEYNLTTDPSDVKMISVKGGFIQATPYTESSYQVDASGSDKMQWWAFASTEWPDDPSEKQLLNSRKDNTSNYRTEGRVISLDHKSSKNKMTLKKLAVRKLMNELIQKVSGNIEIQPMKSSINNGYPQDVKVGDIIGVFPGDLDSNCVNNLSSDVFTVTGVSHNIDGQYGWNMTIDLSRIPRQDIYTAAIPWPKIPETGSDYEDYEKFYRKAMEYDQGSGMIDN